MKILWMTSLRPIGASRENDKIQNLFINSVQNIDKNIKFSLTQFDDSGVRNYLKKKKINSFFKNYKKKFLPKGKKYSNKIMLINALNQYLNNNFSYLVYSTADIVIPANIFDEMVKVNKFHKKKEYCALVYPNILVKNGKIKSLSAPHYGIDIFIFKLNRTSVKKLINSIKYWDQYDWGINDNFYVSICDLLNLPIYNLYKRTSILKFENDFKTINESRNWQISSWNLNKKYFLNFLKKNNLTSFYAHGSYYYLLLKILRIRDLNFKLTTTYLKFYSLLPFRIIVKIFK